jgi:hypothetical protein
MTFVEVDQFGVHAAQISPMIVVARPVEFGRTANLDGGRSS